jgi:hypothetical protein
VNSEAAADLAVVGSEGVDEEDLLEAASTSKPTATAVLKQRINQTTWPDTFSCKNLAWRMKSFYINSISNIDDGGSVSFYFTT